MYKVFGKIKTFFRLDKESKWLSVQVFILSGIVRITTLLIPFNKLKHYIGEHNRESALEINRDKYRQAIKIGWLVQKVSHYTPWQSKCLVQAIVAQFLLRKRKIATTLYLGVFKQDDKLKAHAWLRCGKMIVTGAEAKPLCRQVSKFSNEKKIREIG